MELRIHDVTADFVRAMRALLGELSAEKLKQLSIHGVTPEFVREMREAGYGNATADDLIKLRIHGVDRILLERKTKRK